MYTPENEEEREFLANYNPADYPITMVTVDVIITRGKGFNQEVVLIKRKGYPYRDHWALPGGFVDAGETTIEAAKREVMEEAGMKLKDISFFTIADDPDRDPRGRGVSVVFKAEAYGEPFAGDDAVQALWIPMPTAQVMQLAFDHNVLVAQAWIYGMRK